MTRYLHTMYRITDPEQSREFYEALGLEFRRDMDIVRDGEKEATNYFFGVPGQEEELELTFNRDGRTYELGTGYGHVALAVDDLDATLARLKEQGIDIVDLASPECIELIARFQNLQPDLWKECIGEA